MMVRTGLLWVPPEPSIVLEAVDRRRIRVPFVKVLDIRSESTGCRRLLFIVGPVGVGGDIPFVVGPRRRVHRGSFSRLFPSHSSLFAVSRPFLLSPALAGERRKGKQERWYRRVRCGCSPASCGAHRRG